MDKSTYIAFIKYYENEETKKLIGNIDTEILKSEKEEFLYYTFPLIERMILEIFRLVPEADIEQIEQGIMRTAISIIEGCDSYNVLPSYIIDIIKYYYGDKGPRNTIFHMKNMNFEIKINLDEIIYLISQLLLILTNRLQKYDITNFKDIEEII